MNDIFVMQVEEAFFLGEAGTVLSGKLEAGPLRDGDRVKVEHQEESFSGPISRLEIFRKQDAEAQSGDYVSFTIQHSGGGKWLDAKVLKII